MTLKTLHTIISCTYLKKFSKFFFYLRLINRYNFFETIKVENEEDVINEITIKNWLSKFNSSLYHIYVYQVSKI